MTDMLDDPAAMSPSQRRREIATILARGVLRLRQCRENTHDSRPSRTAEKASESGRGRGERSRHGAVWSNRCLTGRVEDTAGGHYSSGRRSVRRHGASCPSDAFTATG